MQQTFGIGNEAAIEIMIALLAIMLTVAALIIGVVGWFGFASIKTEAIKRAKKEGRRAGFEAANKLFREFASSERAAAYGESQKELPPVEDESRNAAELADQPETARPARKRATSDANLRRRR